MKRLENYNVQGTNQLIEELIKLNYLVKYEDGIALATPFIIDMPNEWANKVVASYKNDEETGGLFFAKIYKDKDCMRLVINNWFEIENVIERVIPESSKANSYLPDQHKYMKLLEENFSKAPQEISFPIHYHTHPTISLEKDRMSFSSVSMLNLSEQDMRASEYRSIKMGNYNLYYINSIITGRLLSGNFAEHRIVYYGKGISPYDFKDIRMKQGSKAVIDNIQEMEGPWKKFFAIVGAGLYAASAVAMVSNNKANLASDMMDVVADLSLEKEYFSVVNSHGSTIVKIPKYNVEIEPGHTKIETS